MFYIDLTKEEKKQLLNLLNKGCQWYDVNLLPKRVWKTIHNRKQKGYLKEGIENGLLKMKKRLYISNWLLRNIAWGLGVITNEYVLGQNFLNFKKKERGKLSGSMINYIGFDTP